MAQKRGRALNVSSAKRKLNELLITWFSLPETEELITSVMRQHKQALENPSYNIDTLREGGMLLTDQEALDLARRRPNSSTSLRLGSTSPPPPLDHPSHRLKSKQNTYSNTYPYHSTIDASPPRSPTASPLASPVQHPSRLKVVDEWDSLRPKVASSPPSSPRLSVAPPAPLSPHHPSSDTHQIPPPNTNPTHSTAHHPKVPSQPSPLDTQTPVPYYSSTNTNTSVIPTSSPTTQNASIVPSANLKPPTTTASSPQVTLNIQQRPASSALIRKFWFPEGRPIPDDEIEKESKALANAFRTNSANKLTKPGPKSATSTNTFRNLSIGQEWTDLVSKVFGLPGWWAPYLFRRLVGRGNVDISYKTVKDWWDKEMSGLPNDRRMFNFLKNDTTRNYIVKKDWEPVIQDLLLVHPGLEFLKQTPEFQDKYAETVVVRIYYTCNRSGNGRMTLKEFQRVVPILLLLDREEDINSVTQFFSYEHFYVLYCKFWELDGDHDFLISKEDLMKYNNYSLTETIVNTIFRGVPRKLTSGLHDRMNYEDFIWFCMSEEDKSTETSLEYWFRCVDLDKDGILSGYELDYYYAEQRKRMESILQEQILYEDILCQMIDMINPKEPKNIRLSDIKNCPTSGVFFNVLFNLNKFIAFEQRDPFQAHAEKQGPEKTEWDRFARQEYDRMAMEAEQGEDGPDPM
eukprot:NODE_671_length_2481_cov_77.005513_g576_i0.p1 GENE.NODE_671_length_2481_cov_77.005513_g576_i0~~NODE_671_length_2481_cov_77.005513_g576_i0.p1  ORF type:complete len:687 (-),score=144.26 NODE_671_length_2481_cov_77.005513_g576_i0:312-2372(-)